MQSLGLDVHSANFILAHMNGRGRLCRLYHRLTSAETLIDVVKDIGDWAHASGIRRLFLVNSHVTNVAPLRCALEMLRAEYDGLMVALVNTATVSERVRERHFADAGDWPTDANNRSSSSLFSEIELARRPRSATGIALSPTNTESGMEDAPRR